MDLHVGIIIAVAGLIAGLINGVVGGASLMTFPILVATGLPPISAVVTNTIGMGGGNTFALLPHLRSRRALLKRWVRPALITGFGGFCGAILLRISPERVFAMLVPALVLFATLTMLLPAPEVKPHGPGSRHTNWRLGMSGVYCGYFGSGMGVISMAVLARDGRLDMREVAIIKNLVIATANAVASAFFIATGSVSWGRALLLFASSALGGYLSGSVIDRSRPDVLRWLVIAIGLGSTLYLTARLLQ
jgi:uncharacterized membrane protein YfcA